MAHFAQLDINNNVLDVVVISNNVVNNLPFPESEPLGIEFCQSLYGSDTNWKQTSYNNSFRGIYAGIGAVYVPSNDLFSTPRPFPSWSLNPDTMEWSAPVPYPDDGKVYYWDEATLSWVLRPPT